MPVLLSGDVDAVLRMFPVSGFAGAPALDGVEDDTRETDVFPDTLEAEAGLSLCALDRATAVDDLPVLLAVAMPPLVDARLVKALSAPMLFLDPCQLLSFIGPACMW